MSDLLEPLVQSPRLPLYVAELNQLLASEQEARQRFRDKLSDSEKGEFINGQIVMHSPARYRHTNVLKMLLMLVHTFVERNKLGWVGFEKVLVALTRNDFEPDIVFYGREKAASLTPDQHVFPAPDLIVEVLSESTEAIDRGLKMEDYAAHGVREYWLVDPEREFVEQYDLEGERYALRTKQTDATLRSQILAGFAVPVRAIFERELNLQVLAQLTAQTL